MQDMAVFVAVVEAGSFTSAAKKLGATTSSVSRQVSRLEDCLHVKLLERTTRNLRLNAAGERVFAQCRITLDSARDVLDVADQICGEPQGRLKIGVPKAYGSQVLLKGAKQRASRPLVAISPTTPRFAKTRF